MKNIPSRFESALRKHAVNLTSAIAKVSDANAGKEYATAAYAGGDRTYFDSEDEINRHYASVSGEGRERGTAALDALLKDMREAVDLGLRISTVKAAEYQAALPLIRDDDALIRFVSEVERRDDYTAVAAAAQYTGKDGISTPVSRAIKNRLDEYEHALSEVIRKSEKFITKSLRGDKNCANGWSDWIMSSIGDASSAYDALQAAISGETGQNFSDMVTAYFERSGA